MVMLIHQNLKPWCLQGRKQASMHTFDIFGFSTKLSCTTTIPTIAIRTSLGGGVWSKRRPTANQQGAISPVGS